MGKIFAVIAAMLLTGCVSVPLQSQLDDVAIKQLVRNVADQVDAFSYSFGLDGEPDFATLQAALAEVHYRILGQARIGLDPASLRRAASLGALGVTISACEGDVDRLRVLYDADRAAAMEQVRGRFRLSCVLPLTMLSA